MGAHRLAHFSRALPEPAPAALVCVVRGCRKRKEKERKRKRKERKQKKKSKKVGGRGGRCRLALGQRARRRASWRGGEGSCTPGSSLGRQVPLQRLQRRPQRPPEGLF